MEGGGPVGAPEVAAAGGLIAYFPIWQAGAFKEGAEGELWEAVELGKGSF